MLMRVTDVFQRRRANLRQLIKEFGGPLSLSGKLGYDTASFLVQMAGPHPTRDISEKTARKIEERLGLSVGWMDQMHTGRANVNESKLAQIVQAVASVFEDARIEPKPKVFGEVVTLAYEHAELVGQIDEAYLRKLVTLCKKS